jgi:hypothetical protein
MARKISGLLLAGAIVLAGSALFTLPAFAAGTDYSGGSPPGSPSVSAACAPGSVITTQTVPSTGGTVSGTDGQYGIAVTIPSGAFSSSLQVIIYDDSASAVPVSGSSVVLTVGVALCQNGNKVSGSFSPPVTVGISGPNITSSSASYLLVGSTLEPVSNPNATAGSITCSFSSDAVCQVTTPNASETAAAIPNATSVVTGKPFLLEGLIAGGLFVFGVLLLLRLRFRRTT